MEKQYLSRPIGEVFEYNGVKLEVANPKRETFCKGCYFKETQCPKELRDIRGTCCALYRDDKTEVIFKPI